MPGCEFVLGGHSGSPSSQSRLGPRAPDNEGGARPDDRRSCEGDTDVDTLDSCDVDGDENDEKDDDAEGAREEKRDVDGEGKEEDIDEMERCDCGAVGRLMLVLVRTKHGARVEGIVVNFGVGVGRKGTRTF